ncbi:hypothetical protein Pcinc_033765 [Petrolisthes cinctipes]|uniref:Uncharacterized protein n=1 Tax=Petrolisthes cinctipes TaxID=88211 RepID=A0AAE1ERQ9_PETCI|nr:hypothetical protein Pcinc_033765 [Petrolisthes cinctipes]
MEVKTEWVVKGSLRKLYETRRGEGGTGHRGEGGTDNRGEGGTSVRQWERGRAKETRVKKNGRAAGEKKEEKEVIVSQEHTQRRLPYYAWSARVVFPSPPTPHRWSPCGTPQVVIGQGVVAARSTAGSGGRSAQVSRQRKP